ncbi:MAG: PEP-utilizing enzyme [Patescibacteria group bacterium]
MKKRAWLKLWNRKHTLQHDYFGRFIWFIDNHYYRIRNMLIVGQSNKKADTYFVKSEWRELMKKLAREIITDKHYLAKNLKQFQVYRQLFTNAARAVSRPTVLVHLSNSELLRRYQILKREYKRYTYFFWTPWALNEEVVPYFYSKLKRRLPADSQSIFDAVIRPTKLNRMELNLLQLSRYKKAIPASHRQEYSYLNVYSLLDRPYTIKNFTKLRQLVRNRRWVDPRRLIIENRLNYHRQLNLLKPYPKLHRLAEIINTYAWLRTERVDVWRKVLLLTQPFYAELERRMNLRPGQAPHLTYEEVVGFLAKNIVPDQHRIKGGELLYLNNGNLQVIRNKREKERILRRELPKPDSRTKIITGQPASPGKVRGAVRIVMTPEDCRKIKKGEILVSNMTHPDYLLGIHKAAAIVTDEGGVSSHAAIVARELKKPCIIGTKIATRVFKDGDKVEVDADKGVVNKI